MYNDCSEEIKISGFFNSLDGIYHKQSRKEATSGHPLYKQIENTNFVIAWSGDFGHWILTDKAHSGTREGFAWFRQDEDEHCPGFGDVTVYHGIESMPQTGSRNKCPKLVEVMGTNDVYDGIYKKSSLSEHGYPVYYGPGYFVLSWAKNHWWITSTSNIGENNGYAYLDVPMDCPGDTFSILRRGGSDEKLPGEKIEAMNLDYGKL